MHFWKWTEDIQGETAARKPAAVKATNRWTNAWASRFFRNRGGSDFCFPHFNNE